MQKIFWLREARLAGRSGPNLDPWELPQFKEAGFAAILSVNDGEMVHGSQIEALGMAYANIPMSPNAPIRPGDKAQCLANLPQALAFIESQFEAGPVLVHCRSGKDRTGLVLAASLMAFEGLGVEEAMDEVFKVRDIAFSAEGWVPFAREVLAAFAEQRQAARCVGVA
ncbi:dual specificity protein phosphatase family protein [Gallaecimonas kandeliae]|uniref:protein-tyrosine phosphatase family protein n=1 Tax=Gallaecimonas kandeliae TaxID=3029055 RepID=UPI00264A4B4B|nr:dual specificity protein phosphatase family protein [Gallaecimonas kandeliae]WKE64256.1 dual specificity protein phosphatase family protein [Gallaecimonas kandeliae]